MSVEQMDLVKFKRYLNIVKLFMDIDPCVNAMFVFINGKFNLLAKIVKKYSSENKKFIIRPWNVYGSFSFLMFYKHLGSKWVVRKKFDEKN